MATKATTPAANRARIAAENKAGQKDASAPRSVYIKPEDTIKDVMVRLESFAESGLRFLSSIVVHMVVRTYALNDADRVSDNKALMAEIENAIQEYAGKKRGKAFEHAWTSRIIGTAKSMCIVLLKEGGKGVAGPVSEILRAKNVDAANDIVFDHATRVTKGSNSFTALSKALNPNPKKQGPQQPTRNATKPAAGTPKSVALRITDPKGHEIFNSVTGNAEKKAVKIADTIGKSNVDHKTFVLSSLRFIDKPEDLLEIAEAAKTMAKKLRAAQNPNPDKRGEAAHTHHEEIAEAKAG